MINTVILDCEGCWVDFIETYQERLRTQVDKIILGKGIDLHDRL